MHSFCVTVSLLKVIAYSRYLSGREETPHKLRRCNQKVKLFDFSTDGVLHFLDNNNKAYKRDYLISTLLVERKKVAKRYQYNKSFSISMDVL